MIDDQKPKCEALSVLSPLEKAIQKYDKPQAPFVSRRLFVKVGAISTAALVISPVDWAMASPPPARGIWTTLLKFVTGAAGLLGFTPLNMLLPNFLSRLGTGSPKVSAILREVSSLLGSRQGYMDPRNWPSTVPFNLLRSGDSRITFPVLNADGLNGITPFFHFLLSQQQAVARLAGPTTIAFEAIRGELIRLGLSEQTASNMLRPISQSKTSFGKFDQSYTEADRFTTTAPSGIPNPQVTANYNNTGRRTGELNVGIENVRNPATGKRVVIETTPTIEYDPES